MRLIRPKARAGPWRVMGTLGGLTQTLEGGWVEPGGAWCMELHNVAMRVIHHDP